MSSTSINSMFLRLSTRFKSS
uniref:Uncharacterized protein n=1 Tax=Rhizophora mucronata TaxID=61149 RepID=A0A2P2ISW0_RHIMU